MKSLFLLSFLLTYMLVAEAQQKALNIPGLHQLVSDSKSEHKLQTEAKNHQALVSANEYQNKTMLARLKNRYRELQERYQALGTILTAANIGINAMPMVDHIIANQIGIYEIAADDPAFLAIAYTSEVEFVNKGRSLVNYLIGLSANIGAINQMKISDRKVLFDFILTELNLIQNLSANLLMSMQFKQANGLIKSINPFQGYIDQDKAIVSDIIRNAKYLTR
ncbi:hypothetical protein [Pedobacter sp. MC2016-24]|uniref:hypothetical protein n=1 Tax=Pedobacter sp. MC2016-24 TaxID=2780090 RepID=UPI00187F3A66|nr:hypothetical protein [Pedobacter sp. MC2016-24]MBE9599897.1 hypothetical protein [Pedobacter sp. MC2016-24]